MSGAPTLSLIRGSTTLALTEANGITVTPGVQGFDTPPVVLSETAPADFDGSIVTNVRYQPREVFVPLALLGDDTDELRTRTRALASLLNPQLGPITLRVTYPDDYREITGYLSAPFADSVTPGEALTWRRLGITLRCEDPLWSGPDTYTLGLTTDPFTVNNPGDAISWPSWTFVLASGFPLTIINTSVPGQPTLEIDDSLSSVTLNSDPRNLSCVDVGTDDPAWQVVGEDSTLFPFYPGDNVITGANFGGLSTASATFRSRWLTAW